MPSTHVSVARALAPLALSFAACGGADAGPEPAAPVATATTGAPVTAPTSEPMASATATPAPSTSAAATAAAPPPSRCPDGTIVVKGGAYKFGYLKRDETVVDLCVDRTEVVASAYAACVKAGKCTDSFLDCAEAKTYEIAGKENHPIVCVNFDQAKSYCDFAGKRLPTEPEWEWIARAGAEGRKYAFGDDAPKDNVCWSGASTGTRKGTCEVGSFPQSNSPEGIVDLTGNVFEWTSSPADATNKMFVTKGGTWRDGVAAQLVSSRPGGFKPEYRCGFGGVRCVATAK